MNILIDASGCKSGGGIQVADSICRNLNRFPMHKFIVVLSKNLEYLGKIIDTNNNIEIEYYTSGHSIWSLITGRDIFLDGLVKKYNIDAVELIFGPSLWIPKVVTIAGFAIPHLLLLDSPFWNSISKIELIKIKLRNYLQRRSFRLLSKCYYTENPYISDLLKQLFPDKRIETITNSYHQVFNDPIQWDTRIPLPNFKGFSLLTISAPYSHKNLKIIPFVIDELQKIDSEFKFRFIVTCQPSDIEYVKANHLNNIVFLGKVSINQCPPLYQQSDAMFLPTMLECFSASYIEAMKMNKPIITSDLGFAKGLCNEGAVYFNPINPKDIAKKIYRVAKDETFRNNIVSNASKQLYRFDSPEDRVKKIIALVEDEYLKSKNQCQSSKIKPS